MKPPLMNKEENTMGNTIKTLTIATLLPAALALAACGETTGDRALSGAGIGAGVGALGTALTGGNATTGALVGGAVGAAGGALTNPNQVDLGKPAWRR
jgi:hypothetical protein